MVSKNHKLQQMVQKWKRCSGTEKGLIIMFVLLPILLVGGIVFALNFDFDITYGNRNLAIEFDDGGHRATYYTGNVVFKKDFEDVSLDMYVSAIGSPYPKKVIGYDLHLTDEDGNEVTNVTAGKTYRFHAEALLERREYTLYSAGMEVLDDINVEVRFLSGNKTLYTMRD